MAPLAFMGFILGYSLTFSLPLVEISNNVELSLLFPSSVTILNQHISGLETFHCGPPNVTTGELILVMDRTSGFDTVQSTQQLKLFLNMDSVVKSLLEWLYQMSWSMG